ncbi:MAG: hypothetical protein ABI233_06665 [Chthoniobacterales bacterium]
MWLPNFGYHFARLEGDWRRKAYRALLPAIVRRPVRVPRAVPFSVFAYSNEDSVPEQVRSIRSFLRHVGRPTTYRIGSDGSHTEASRRLLLAIDPSVSIESTGENLPADLPEKFRHYVTTYPMGKQLGLIMSLPRDDEPVLYADSDILFFGGASDLLERAAEREAPAYYLPDCHESSADQRVFREPNESKNPVNSGLLLLFRKLDWSLGIERLLELEGEPNFFTNQTLLHLVIHANGARPLDPRKYVLQLDDQTIYPDRYAGPELALRHYVNPVRHKFWTTL